MNKYSEQKSVTELTAEKIREAIILGSFPLGTKLSEQKLADLYEVSRSPVREALVLLQIEGLVRIFPKRGSFVFSPDERTIVDLCEHRNVLETVSLKLGIERNHASLLSGLELGIDQMQTAIETKNTKDYSLGDLKFHRTIIASSGNRSMIAVYETTIGRLIALRTHLFTVSGVQTDRSMSEHIEILRACEKKDIARAQAICTEHINHLAEHVADANLKSTF
ncbi:GntR family transcriptional regulator [Shimia sp. NS0008-38b]|uniref:GntR family transcriptional regulator n=1 Tax=Shimia sp. NS0008-38b TaxID=3127653 RepID=UPI00333EA350